MKAKEPFHQQVQKKAPATQGGSFMRDNRSSTTAQLQLQAQMQAHTLQKTARLMGLKEEESKEEEPIQALPEPLQRAASGEEEEKPLQRKFESDPEKTGSHEGKKENNTGLPDTSTSSVQETSTSSAQAIQRKSGNENNTGLPDTLKSGIENLSGYSMDDVKVHYNSPQPAQLQAHAYAQGTDIHIAPGQEKHLPHEAWHVVQQKQGRVQPTQQLKGKVNINDDAGLEKEADVMGAKALQQVAINKGTLQQKQITSDIVQGAFGMEKESKVPVTDDENKPVENYPTIGDHSLFKVDIDKSKGKSILEVVTKHFNEHQGATEDAIKELEKRLTAAWLFLEAAQKAKDKTPLKNIADEHQVALGGPYQDLIVKDGGTLKGPVHFTVGFSLESIPQLLQELTKQATGKSAVTKSAVKRTGQAPAIGKTAFDLSKNTEKVNPLKIAGFMELLYTQVSALLDGVKDEERGLVKNRTVALARVSMGAIRESLTKAEQTIITNKKFYEPVLGLMQQTYSGTKGQWGSHKNDKDLFAPLARQMLKAAFNVDTIKHNDPSDDKQGFGKMTVVPNSEPVGDQLAPETGFALELRKIQVKEDSNRDSVMEAAVGVIKLSRGLNKTPEPKKKEPEKLSEKQPMDFTTKQSSLEENDDQLVSSILSSMNFQPKKRSLSIKNKSFSLTITNDTYKAIKEIASDRKDDEIDVKKLVSAFKEGMPYESKSAIFEKLKSALPSKHETLAEEITEYIVETYSN